MLPGMHRWKVKVAYCPYIIAKSNSKKVIQKKVIQPLPSETFLVLWEAQGKPVPILQGFEIIMASR